MVNTQFDCFILFLILDESSPTKIEEKNPSDDHLNVPSTSKASLLIKENNISDKKSDVDRQNCNESIYFVSKSLKTEELNVLCDVSPSVEFDNSNDSISENSVNFSPEESLPDDDIILQGLLQIFLKILLTNYKVVKLTIYYIMYYVYIFFLS